jgi:hypothetical protein
MKPVTYRPIENPVTGDRCQVSEISAEELRIRFWVAPGSEGPPLHFHQLMTETFTVLEVCIPSLINGTNGWFLMRIFGPQPNF